MVTGLGGEGRGERIGMRLCVGTMELTEKLETGERSGRKTGRRKRGGKMGMRKKLYPT